MSKTKRPAAATHTENELVFRVPKLAPKSKDAQAGFADATRAETLLEYLKALGELVGNVDAGGASEFTLNYTSMLHGELVEELQAIVFPKGKVYSRFMGGQVDAA